MIKHLNLLTNLDDKAETEQKIVVDKYYQCLLKVEIKSIHHIACVHSQHLHTYGRTAGAQPCIIQMDMRTACTLS